MDDISKRIYKRIRIRVLSDVCPIRGNNGAAGSVNSLSALNVNVSSFVRHSLLKNIIEGSLR